MPVGLPTDTLRVVLDQASFDAGVLRLAGRVEVRGPRTPTWAPAIGAGLALRPPDPVDGSEGAPGLPDVIRKPLVLTGAGRQGAFEVGLVASELDGYVLEARWTGAFVRALRLDSLVAAHRAGG